jgi:ribosomal protein S18 acetylase RimI-like enzyme
LKLKIEVLSKTHNRIAFDCSDNELNYYLQKIARQHITKGISKTFVLIDIDNPTEIIAYMTLAVCEIQADEIPHNWKNKYPDKIPAAKLARLAVSTIQQRKGYGELLVIDAIQKTLNVSSSIGIVGLFVDAKNEQAKAYYDQFGFISLPKQLDNLFLPLATLAKSLDFQN